MKMEIDDSLKAQYGTRRPFTVPDGYFERLGETVTGRLSASGSVSAPVVRAVRKSVWQRLSPLVAAASVVGVVMLVGLGVRRPAEQPAVSASLPASPSVAKTAGGTDELDRVADYSMMDEDDVYAYISSE